MFHQFHLKQKYYPHLTENIIPPLEVLDQILLETNFKYRTNYISSDGEVPPIVTLVDIETGIDRITVESLSPGEKTIMSLIFFLYHASSKEKLPEVILFDEPDAHLHPSLTQTLLTVIENIFVNQHKVKVILTTHSPSTIALSPEQSIYRMDKRLGYPVKENKNSAVKTLSNGLAAITYEEGNLGISYNINGTDKNILFTEGITDKIIIELAWTKLYPEVEMPFLIQDCFSASFLGNLFNQGDQIPDGLFKQFPKRKMIALFDFDSTGYSNWNRENKFPDLIENDPRKCLVRSNGLNGFLMLLPAPDVEHIRDLVIKNGNETFEDSSRLTIESLFLNAPNFKEIFFKLESIVGGGSVYIFKPRQKRKFATNLNLIDSIHFKEFIPLFKKIKALMSK